MCSVIKFAYIRTLLSIVSVHVSHGAGFNYCWSCHKIQLQVNTAEAMFSADARWQNKSNGFVSVEEIWAGKGLQVLILQVTDMEILLINPSSLHWPLERNLSSGHLSCGLLILVGSAGSPLDVGAVSQTCTLLSQPGGSLKSHPHLDSLPEQALPIGLGTGTRTTLIGWFLWQPSYWFVPVSSLPWTSWMWKASGSYYISLPVRKGEKRKLLKWCNYKRIVPVECIISLYLGLSFSQSLTWDREMETEWEKAQERTDF